MQFDGQGGYVEISNHPDFQGGSGNSFTIEAWAKVTDLSEDRPIIQKWLDKRNKEWGMTINSGSVNNIAVAIENNGNDFEYEAGGGIVQDNAWHHIAMTYDGNAHTLKIIIDGQEVGSSPVPDGMPSTNATVQIGHHRYKPEKKFLGEIDQIRIWNLVRTPSAIQADMFDTLNGDEAGLIAYYQFDEGSGSTTADQAGNGHTGQFNQGPSNDPFWVASTAPIAGDAFITVTSPNGGEVFEQGDAHTITWISGGAGGHVMVELSEDGGTTWSLVDNSTNNDGRFNWTVPAIVTASGLIRITDTSDTTVRDASNATFAIVAGGGDFNFSFSDITTSAGTGGPEGAGNTGGHAAVFADVDGDDRSDLYHTMLFSSQIADLFFRNTGGSVFADEGAARGIDDLDGGSHGAVFADLDNDGDFDLFNGTTGLDGSPEINNVFRNNSSGIFTDVSNSAGITRREPTRGVVAFDMDSDGDLDLFAVSNFQGSADPSGERNEVYRNDGNLQFTEITTGGLYTAPAGQGATDTDYDGDGDIDIIAGNRTGSLNVLRNDGSGNFTLLGASSIGITHQGREGVTMGDVDNDGDLDMLLSDFNDPQNVALEHLYLNDGDGTFTFKSSFTDTKGFMGGFADLDNDGDLDIVFSGDDVSYVNDGSGNFTVGPSVPVSGIDDPRAIAFSDIDDDGDLDFAIGAKRSRNWLVRNNLTSGNWLKVGLVSPSGQKGAFGAKIKIYAAGQLGGQLLAFREARAMNGYLGQNAQNIHFGLDSRSQVDVQVIFLDGTVSSQTFVSANQTIIFDESPGGGAGPQISSFTPTSGAPGITVSISGTGFTGTSEVLFNGTAATGFSVLSDVALDATVPAAATTGTITVTTPAGSATSTQVFTVTAGNTVTFVTSDDGQVKLTEPSKNYGSKSTTKVEEDKFNTYLKFNVSGLSGAVESARVRLRVSAGTSDGGPDGGSLFLVSNDFLGSSTPWVENSLSAGNAPQISGNSLSSAGAVTPLATVDFDVSAAVSGNGTYSFGLKNGSGNQVKYYTKEGSFAPELIVQVGSGGGGNTAPTAVDDNATTTEPNPVQIDVVANDFDSDGSVDANSVAIVSNPTNGSVSVAGGGLVTYTPTSGFSGQDTFTYTVDDNEGAASNSATVTVTVDASGGGGTGTFTFIATDDGQVKLTEPGKNYGTKATMKVEQDKFASYMKFNVTGLSGQVVSAKVRLLVSDGSFDGSTEGGSIYPVANSFLGGGVPWVQSSLNAGNAPAISGSPLSTVGTVLSNSFVDFDVTAAFGSNGEYSFAISNTSTNQAKYYSREGASEPELIIEVSGGTGNQPPTAVDDNVATSENIPVVITVTQNDSDPDGTLVPATVAITTGPGNGSTAVNPANGVVTYTPASGFSGSDSFRYTVEDNEGAVSNEALVSVQVNGTNALPVAVDDTVTVSEDVPSAISVLLNDDDSDGSIDPTTVSVTSGPGQGTATVNPSTGEVTYAPALNFFGNDTFSYTVKDNDGAVSNQATVTISVTPVNDAPVAANDSETITGSSVVLNVTANDTDIDGTIDVTTVTVVSFPSSGSVVVNPFSGIVTYTAGGGFSESDSFTYEVRDDGGQTSNVATVTIFEPGSQKTLFSFGAAEDSYVKTTEPGSNFGGRNTMKVESPKFSSYVKFNVTGLNGNVQSAHIKLFVSSPSVDGGTIYLASNTQQGSGTPWTEETLTFANAPEIIGSALFNPGAVQELDTASFEVTSAIGGNGVYSFCIQSTSLDQAKYAAKESSNPDPVLEIITDGVPPAAPTVSALNPDSGLPGSEIVISGSDFIATSGGNPFSGTIQIMPLGNSITKGVAGATDNAGYRNDLAELLDLDGVAYNFVGTNDNGTGFDNDHEGHGGIRADQILVDLNSYLTTNPPDIVLVHIGTNDISTGNTPASTADETGQIIDTIEQFDAETVIIVASLVPRKDQNNDETTDLNNRVEDLVAARQLNGEPVYYAPINEAFIANPNWQADYFPAADQVHPNDTGYGVMAGVWFDLIKNIISGSTGITVAFNGSDATSLTVDSANQIRATVPGTASTGPVTVTTQYGSGQGPSAFTVLDPTIAALELEYPQDAVVWQAGSTHMLQWRTLGKVEDVRIQYSLDDGETWLSAAERVPNNGKFVWRLPSGETERIKLRVSDAQNRHIESITENGVSVRQRGNTTSLPNWVEMRQALASDPELDNASLQRADLNGDEAVDLLDFLSLLDLDESRLAAMRDNRHEAGPAEEQGNLSLILPAIEPPAGKQVEIPILAEGNEKIRGFQFRLNYDSEALTNIESVSATNELGMVLETFVADGYVDVIGYLEMEGSAVQTNGELVRLKAELSSSDVNFETKVTNVLFVSQNLGRLTDTVVDNSTGSGSLPSEFRLAQNYPNPFNPTTQINFDLPQKSKVTIQIYSIRGELVATLLDKEIAPGRHKITWDGRNSRGVRAASGIYIYRIKAGKWKNSKRMTLLK